MVRPLVEYSAPVWDPHQQTLIDRLEMTQRRSARRILRDFRPTSSATALVAKLNLPPLKQRRTAAKATMMYKIMGGLVDAQPKEGTLQLTQRTTHGHPSKLRAPQSSTDTHLYSFFSSAIRL